MPGAALDGSDYVILAVYMLAVVCLGSWVGRGQTSTAGYLLAERKSHWFVVCVSIIATDLSAVSYMGVPGWLYRHDLKYFMASAFSPLIMLLVVVVFVRTYHRLGVVTVYEYLEHRFHPISRTVIAVLFLFQRGVWLAGAIYIPCVAVVTTTRLPLIACILTLGLLTTLYTVLGGMKAVLWTDFLQFLVLIGGLFVMIGVLLASFHWDIPGVWAQASRMIAADSRTPHTTMIDWRFDLWTEAAIWGLFLHLVTYQMGSYGADQVIAQRYFTMDNFRRIARSVVGSGFLTVGVVYALAFLGILLVVYYDRHPHLAASLNRPDEILPHFVASVLPGGVRGVIIAAILAATMSSVSSALNSFAAVGVMDLYKRHVNPTDPSEAHLTRLAKLTTLVCGIAATLAAVWVSTFQTTILQTVASLASKFIGPITGIFLMGALTKRANVVGVIVGAVVGLVLAILVDYEPLRSNVNWMWIAPLTCLACFVSGYTASLLSPGFGRKGPGAGMRRTRGGHVESSGEAHV